MKIRTDIQKTPSVKSSKKAGNTSAAKKSDSAGSSGQDLSVKKAAVSVSSSSIGGALASDSSQRAENVARIKLAVDSGNYDENPEQTADKLIDNLTDYSLA